MRAGEAVRDAVRFLRTVERDVVGYTLAKANGSPVTAADFVVQAFVASRLAGHFPGDPLVAEENASALRGETARPIRERVCCRWRKPVDSGRKEDGDRRAVAAIGADEAEATLSMML